MAEKVGRVEAESDGEEERGGPKAVNPNEHCEMGPRMCLPPNEV